MRPSTLARVLISMLHHYLEYHSLRESDLAFHADNCSKIDSILHEWWCQGLTTASVCHLIVGHTKFTPSWWYGLLKRAFRCTKVGCLDIVQVVEESTEVNHAQLVGALDGTVIMSTYDWAGYHDPYFKQTAFKGIKVMHHKNFRHTIGKHLWRTLLTRRRSAYWEIVDGVLINSSSTWAFIGEEKVSFTRVLSRGMSRQGLSQATIPPTPKRKKHGN